MSTDETNTFYQHLDRYHAHLDACPQCRQHPFDQCLTGNTLIKAAVDAGAAQELDFPKTKPSER